MSHASSTCGLSAAIPHSRPATCLALFRLHPRQSSIIGEIGLPLRHRLRWCFRRLCFGPATGTNRSRFLLPSPSGCRNSASGRITSRSKRMVFGQKFVAPDRDRLESQRAFTQPPRSLYCGLLDPLAMAILALTRFSSSTDPHFPAVHALRGVRAVQLFSGRASGQRHITRLSGGGKPSVRTLGVFFSASSSAITLMPISGQHRHHVLDLLRKLLDRAAERC